MFFINFNQFPPSINLGFLKDCYLFSGSVGTARVESFFDSEALDSAEATVCVWECALYLDLFSLSFPDCALKLDLFSPSVQECALYLDLFSLTVPECALILDLFSLGVPECALNLDLFTRRLGMRTQPGFILTRRTRMRTQTGFILTLRPECALKQDLFSLSVPKCALKPDLFSLGVPDCALKPDLFSLRCALFHQSGTKNYIALSILANFIDLFNSISRASPSSFQPDHPQRNHPIPILGHKREALLVVPGNPPLVRLIYF